MPVKPTFEADTIAAVSQKAAYDESCKKVLALKEIAARILAAVVEEFKGYSIEEIIACIGTPEIGNVPVDVDTPIVPLENSEDTTMTEGKRFFDIRFTVRLPKSGEYIYLIINLEAQKDFTPGYSLIKRGIYYCSRLISSQYGTVFTNSDYDKIRKVYSIWICTNPDDEHRGTITQYSMSQKCIEGKIKNGYPVDTEKERREYDLMSLVMICLDDPKSGDISDTGIMRMLSVLFSDDMDFRAKITILESEYNIKMTEEVEEEVGRMCNLSEGVWQKGLKKGRTEQRIEDVKNLLSIGMKFDDIIKALKISPESAIEIKEQLGN